MCPLWIPLIASICILSSSIVSAFEFHRSARSIASIRKAASQATPNVRPRTVQSCVSPSNSISGCYSIGSGLDIPFMAFSTRRYRRLEATVVDFDGSQGTYSAKLPLTEANVEAVLTAEVRPALEADGGGVDFVAIDGSSVHVRLRGACSSCPRAYVTLQSGVLRKLQERIEGVGNIVQVVDD